MTGRGPRARNPAWAPRSRLALPPIVRLAAAMMAWPTLQIAFILLLIGVVGFFVGHPDPATGHVSYTALIPAAIGLVLGVLGAVSFKAAARKHAMHAAAMVALLSILAVAARLPGTLTEFFARRRVLLDRLAGGVANPNTADALPLYYASTVKLTSMVATLIVCVFFLVLCIRSFIAARRARQAAVN